MSAPYYPPDALRQEARRRGRPTRLYRLRRYSPTTGEIVGTRFYAQSPAAMERARRWEEAGYRVTVEVASWPVSWSRYR